MPRVYSGALHIGVLFEISDKSKSGLNWLNWPGLGAGYYVDEQIIKLKVCPYFNSFINVFFSTTTTLLGASVLIH